MNKESCPAIVCCGGRMDFHGQPGWTVSIVLTKNNRVRALWTLVNFLEK